MILLFCGPPGSGKSTIARRVAAKLADSHLISSDKIPRRVYRRLFAQVRERRGRQRWLILDATFYKRWWRDEVRVIAGEEQVITIHITASLESCLSRNRERARPIPERAVRIIHSEFERPERPDLYIDTDKLSLEQAVAAVLRHLSNIQS